MISNKVEEIRKKRGIPVAELARRTRLSRVTITNIERHKVIPSIESAIYISRELDCEIGDIFFEISVNRELQKGVK